MRAVLQRDLIAEGTRPRAFVVRGLVAAAATLVVLLAFGSSRWQGGVLGPAAFRQSSWLALLAVALVGPAASADAVLEERRNRTLHLAIISPEGPRGFLLGKLLSRTGLLVSLLATALPALTAALLLDNADWWRFAGFLALALATALEVVTWGLMASSAFERSGTAAAAAIAAPALRWWLTMRGFDALRSSGLLAAPVADWVSSGLQPLSFLVRYGAVEGHAPPGLSGPALSDVGAALLARPEFLYLVLAGLFAATAVLGADGILAWGEPAVTRSGGSRRAAWLRHGRARRLAARSGAQRLLAFNPVLWKDAPGWRTAGGRVLQGLGALAVVATAVALNARGRAFRGPVMDPVGIATAAITVSALLAAVRGSAMFAKERTQGTLELLRLTRLTPREVLAGKALALAFPHFAIVGFVLVHVTLAAGLGTMHPLTGAMAVVLAVFTPAAWGILGLRWGFHAPTPGYARAGAGMAFLTSFLGCFGLPLVPILFFAEEVLEVRTKSRVFGSIIIPGLLMGSPVWVTSSVLSCMDASFRPDLWPYRYVAHNMGWLIPAAISMVAHGTFLLLLSREMPLLVRRDLRKEEEPMAGPRDFPSLKQQIERRRLAREERRQGIRAPSRLWNPVVRPALAPPRPPGTDSAGTR